MKAGEGGVALYYTGGLGTPIGVGGVEGVARIYSSLEIAGGVGLGLLAAGAGNRSSPTDILQWSVMPRLLWSDGGESATTIGAGISGGGFGSAPGCNFLDILACNYELQYVLWANAELGRETWPAKGGLAFRYFVGYGHGFAKGRSYNIPYVGFSIGYGRARPVAAPNVFDGSQRGNETDGDH